MRYFYILFALLTFISCQKDDEDIPTSVKTRTVLVYMGGDNNLSVETYDKLQELKKGWNPSCNGKLLVYQDTPFQDSPRLLEITDKNEIGYIVVKKYEPANSADPAVFQSVIDEVVRAYPSDSYGLVLFSHASGWLPSHTINPRTRSIIIDKDDEMELTDFAAAIPDNLFSFIVFEACNMAGIEVVYELKDKADYILASSAPIISPGFTPIYAGNIKYLFEETPDLRGFAEEYFNHWNAISGIKRSATISLIKTSELSALSDIIRKITHSGSMDLAPEMPQNYDGTVHSPYYFFDLAQYYNQTTDESLKASLQRSLDKCVVYKKNTPNYATSAGVFPISFFSGMTTFIPQQELETINNEYLKLRWSKAISRPE